MGFGPPHLTARPEASSWLANAPRRLFLPRFEASLHRGLGYNTNVNRFNRSINVSAAQLRVEFGVVELAMSTHIRRLYAELRPDDWRLTAGFSPELAATQDEIWRAMSDPSMQASAVSRWLQENQPCLFGRIAAKWGLITYCFLNEDDLQKTDLEVREKIQAPRTEWSRQAFDGKKSAFVILAATPRLAAANPDEHLLAFSRRFVRVVPALRN